MRVLVVYAHPVPTSFCAAVHATAVEALRRAGHELRDLDLYAEGFAPVLSRAERERYMDTGRNEEGIEEQLAHLRWAEALIFIYPTWWYSLPAILKGWFDRVWVPGATFGIDERRLIRIRPRLGHIRLVGAVSTYGSPGWWMRLVVRDPGRAVIRHGIVPLCARRCRTLWLGHYGMDTSTAASRRAFLAKVERRLAAL